MASDADGDDAFIRRRTITSASGIGNIAEDASPAMIKASMDKRSVREARINVAMMIILAMTANRRRISNKPNRLLQQRR